MANETAHQQAKNENKERRFIILIVIACVILISVGQVMMRKGMSSIDLVNILDILQPARLVQVIFTPAVFFGFAIYGIAMILWLGAMAKADLSYMYPLLSLGYIATTLAAVIVLGEHVSLGRWAGTIAVVIGSFIVTRS